MTPGSKLGPYEIVAPIGAGGMGEVYRARDSKLKRDVALKVLPAAFASDPDRMARFRREAELLASLNHPNIATIYGFQDNALVMELVEGPTLADRIKDRGIPLEEALKVARQIAEALEYAHDRGIIHRDLKPANVKVTPDGTAKVLDFGLAKAIEDPAPSASPADSPTITLAAATHAGVILGTAAYMSPEQAHGKNADRRADIWSFGALLYEMLTGEQAFKGESVSDTLASVLKLEPDWTPLPANTPAAIRKLLRRCLMKERKQRLQAIGEARIAIEESLSGVAEEPVATVSKKRSIVPWAIAGVLALVLLVVAGLQLYNATRPAPLRPLMRLSVEIAPDTPLARAGSGNMLALSPDGARLALMLRGADGKARLHTRLLNESEVTPLMGTEDASDPFFSPDGEWIGFFADGKLKKISVNGGAAATLCDAPAGRGASWGDDGNIIAALDLRGVLSRVPSEGGTPVPVTKLNPGEQTHRWPQVLPGSQAVLFTSAAALAPSYDGANVEVVSLKTGERKTVERGGFFPRYLPTSTGTGHLVYLRGSTLFAVPFDPRRLATTGSPAPIIEDVAANNVGGGDFAFGGAPSGPATFVYLAGKEQGGWSILWVDRQGKTQPLAPRGPYLGPRFSPDGRRLAFAMLGGQSSADIWVKDLDRDTPSRLTFLRGRNGWPVWTPDGKNIVFASEDQATLGLYSIRSDGSGEPRRLTDGKLQEAPSSFSPDGKRLALFQNANAGNEDIFTAAVETDPASGGVRLGKAELFLGSPLSKWVPAFSPDGRWLAYQEGDVGRTEVYVRPFPGPGGKWQISTGGGRFPVWSRDGRELLFETPNFGVMTVNYTVKGDSFAAEQPRAWPGIHLWDAFVFPNYDLAPDGKHLAALVAGDPSIQKPPTHLTFLLNFYDELRRRAPGPK